MLTNVDRIYRRETAGANPDIDCESIMPVILMSSVRLTISLLIAALVATSRRLRNHLIPLYEYNTGARIAHRFVVAVFEKAHPHAPAFPHTHVLVPFTTEWAGNNCRSAVTREMASRLNLNRSTGWAGDHCGYAITRGACRLNRNRSVPLL